MNHDKGIEECMLGFDFSKARLCMEKFNWTVSSSTTEDKIPSVYEIMKTARSCLDSCVKYLENTNGKEAYCSTAGIEASIINDEGEYFYELKFVVASSGYPII